jgi:glucokinase
MNDPQPLVQDRLSRNSWGFLGSQGYVLGMDIGSYGLRSALIDLHAHTYHSVYRDSSAPSAEDLLGESIALSRELLDKHGVALDRLVRVGVGFAGPVDARRGVVQLSPRVPGWEQFPLQQRVQETFGAVTLIDNDANLIALAEATFGIGRDVQDLVYLHISSGVGGGLVLNGRLYHGATTMAGEIGHAPIGSIDPMHPDGPPHTLEQHLSVRGLLRRAAELGLETDLLSDVFGDDPIGRRVVGEAVDVLAVRLAQIVALLDPQMVILGGAVTRAGGDRLIAAIEERMRSYMASLVERPVTVAASVLGFESVAIGGLALALESMRD